MHVQYGHAFGLTIRSELELPELAPAATAQCDVSIEVGRVPVDGPLIGHRSYREGPHRSVLRWPGVTALVSGGDRVVADVSRSVTSDTVRLFVLGPVMAAVLRQRGMGALHASAVSLGHSSVAFVGGCGWGKSTTAAALYARGHTLLADDLLVTVERDDSVQCHPGVRRLRVTPAMARRLGLRCDREPNGASPAIDEKCAVIAGERVGPSARPLTHVFVLGDAPAERLEAARLSPQAALPLLLAHAFTARWLTSSLRATHFATCAPTAKYAGVYRVRATRHTDGLDELVELVERIVQRDHARRAS